MQHIRNAEQPWIDKLGYSKKLLVTPEMIAQPGLLVQQVKIAPGQVAKKHYHKVQTEIFYFTNTVGHFMVNGETIHLKVGDILIVEPNDWHEVSNNEDFDFIYVAFKFDWVEGDYYED